MKAVKYELMNNLGNPATIIFGIFMPVFMGILISRGVAANFPESLQGEIGTSVILSISTIIPLAVCLLGYGAVYSQEVEKQVPLRLRLFGITETDILKSKIEAHLLIITFSSVLYFIILKMTTQFFIAPGQRGIIRVIIIILLLSAVCVTIAHAVSNITGKFGPTFAILMGLYFLLMLLGGMMGPRYESFPPILQRISDLSPVTVFGKDSWTIWRNSSYNWGHFIQSFLFMGSLAAILFIVSVRKNNRNKI